MSLGIEEALRTPAGTAALIKIYFALYIAQSIQLSKFVPADRSKLRTIQQVPPERVWEFATSFHIQLKEDQVEYYRWSTSNPMFGVKTTFIGS